ncbi:hypothetical protein EMCRGX_G014160 [Ephydatia muelleri]
MATLRQQAIPLLPRSPQLTFRQCLQHHPPHHWHLSGVVYSSTLHELFRGTAEPTGSSSPVRRTCHWNHALCLGRAMPQFRVARPRSWLGTSRDYLNRVH